MRVDLQAIDSFTKVYNRNIGKAYLRSHILILVEIKASEPHWNSMRFFAMGSLSYMDSLQEVKFATLLPAKFKHVENCNVYVTMLWNCEISKKLTLNPRLLAKSTPLFSPYMGTRFKYLLKLCPYILIYSALHIMQWFSQILDVFTPKIRRKYFDFYILQIKINVAYTRL